MAKPLQTVHQRPFGVNSFILLRDSSPLGKLPAVLTKKDRETIAAMESHHVLRLDLVGAAGGWKYRPYPGWTMLHRTDVCLGGAEVAAGVDQGNKKARFIAGLFHNHIRPITECFLNIIQIQTHRPESPEISVT